MKNIDEFMAINENSDLLRFSTAGSVDDGKSTLIGRLLHDSNNIYEDQLKSVGKDSEKLGRNLDLALLMDGLKSEREQGITIDVAYRYFSTPKRRFIIADTPGHEQYTRNMATGASTADLAIILVDAENGILTQTKRHSFISALFHIPHIVVVVNKMDLVNWSQERFNEIVEEYKEFAMRLEMKDITFIPISALEGDNVVNSSENMKWYEGTTLLHHLENVYTGSGRNMVDFRFPVQYVNRPNHRFRGFCGTIASGIVRPGDDVTILPSQKTTKIKSVIDGGEEVKEAFASMAVTLETEDEVDISRGDFIVHSGNHPYVGDELEAMMIWMNETPLKLGNEYVLKQGSRMERFRFSDVTFKINPEDLHRNETDELHLNEIGRVNLSLFKAIPYDEYHKNRSTGSFIVIDRMQNLTVGAGMIIKKSKNQTSNKRILDMKGSKIRNIFPQAGLVSHADRCDLLGQTPKTLWLTGLSGSGKSTIAFALEKRLFDMSRPCYVLDGDNIRDGINKDMSFSAEDRKENIRRIAEIAKLFNDAGITVITSFISPFREDRESAKQIIGEDLFREIYINTPLDICKERDPKGLYAKVNNGEIQNFTGIDSPYEEPESHVLEIKTTISSVDQAVDSIIEMI
jgi:bifunctional enzyme CysN/CysC